MTGPKQNPFFGEFGGMYVPEILMPALLELEENFLSAINDTQFNKELDSLLYNYAGRPTPITKCKNISTNPLVKIYLKREDLLHGGAHKTNQVLGQGLLAKKMGKKEIIAETGAGQHGVASALVSALLGLKCRIYMGSHDVQRQKLNVFRMELMGAKVIPVENGAGTLKDAVNEAMRDWSASYKSAHYMLGTAAGPHPYPQMVKHFQRIIGVETKQQLLKTEGCLPDAVIASVGGGSNAIGIFDAFIPDKKVALYGIEPGGLGIDTAQHGAALSAVSYGVLHGAYTAIMQDKYGQIIPSYSISAGLDYPAVGPEHCYLKSINRAHYVAINDDEAVEAFQILAHKEGIIPALESAHALAFALQLANQATASQTLVVNLSGRGDKDLDIVKDYLNSLKK